MDLFAVISVLISVSTVFSFINYRYFKMPRTVGLMLFILIGIEVLVLNISIQHLLAGLVLIPAVLITRLLSVGIPFGVLERKPPFHNQTVKILTWGGLRGAIARPVEQGHDNMQVVIKVDHQPHQFGGCEDH